MHWIFELLIKNSTDIKGITTDPEEYKISEKLAQIRLITKKSLNKQKKTPKQQQTKYKGERKKSNTNKRQEDSKVVVAICRIYS